MREAIKGAELIGVENKQKNTVKSWLFENINKVVYLQKD